MNQSKNIAIFKKYFSDQEDAEEQIRNFIDENFDRIEENNEPIKIYLEIGGL